LIGHSLGPKATYYQAQRDARVLGGHRLDLDAPHDPTLLSLADG
jgi:hypothetical protein